MTHKGNAQPEEARKSLMGAKKLGKRSFIVAGATVTGIALGTAGAAAYWAATGNGNGTASARTFVAPTVSTGTASGPTLYPGLTANGTSTGGTLVVTATNTNPFPITVTVTMNGSATGCTTPDISLASTGNTFTLPAGASSVSRTLTNVVSMGASASNDCQGKTITIPLTTASVSN